MSKHQNLLQTHASFQDVLDALASPGSALPNKRRAELARAVRRFCGHLNRPPAHVPAASGLVRAQLKALAKAKPHLADKTLQNLRTLLNSALHEVRFPRPPLHAIKSLPPAWATLWASLHSASWSNGRLDRISPLLRFAAGLCAPEEMNDTVALLYAQRRHSEIWQADPELAIRRTLQEWNRAAREVPGWPQAPLTLDSKRPRPLALADFPQALQDDIAAFERWALKDSAGRSQGNGRVAKYAYKPRTVKEMRGKILYAARILVDDTHRKIHDLQSIEDVLNRETIPLILEAANRRAEVERKRKAAAALPDERQGAETAHEATCVTYFRMILSGLRPLTAPEAEMLTKCRRKATPEGSGQMTVKNQRRVAQFTEDSAYYDLQDLPYQLFESAERARKTRGGAVTAQEARAVAVAVKLRILDICPIRPGMLARLHLERHILYPTRRGGPAVVQIQAAETKTGTAIQFELDADTVYLLTMYRRHYLPKIGKANGFLFPGGRGCDHIDVDTVTNRVAAVVRKHLGKRVNGHLFRHLKAFRVLRDSGRNWELAADTLGQRSPRTTRQYYALVSTSEATRTADDLIRAGRQRKGYGAGSRFRKGI